VTRVQFGLRNHDGVAWESHLLHADLSISKFVEEFSILDASKALLADISSQNPTLASGSSSTFEQSEAETEIPSRGTHWGYISYKHVAELFGAQSTISHLIDWKFMGIDQHGENSTFWLGSEGAQTQCHMDSYGWNVVAQLYGSKTWTLFPPSSTPFLYPTRVPYEESSIFSQVHIAKPDLLKHPLFAKAVSCQVTLHAGDTLYVPKHWWHHVHSDSMSLSVNLWSPHAEDNRSRVNEAIVSVHIVHQ
jgi:hypothetical protein